MSIGSHRRIAIPPYFKAEVVDGAWQKRCRRCRELLLKPDGTADLRRNWHRACADEYLAANPRWLRRTVFKRDGGVCAACGIASRFDWEADHITPLIDGGAMTLANVQTLCLRCHVSKTSAEAAERREARRSQSSPPPSPQPSLLDGLR